MELALWSFHFAKKLQPELLDDDSNSCEPKEPRGKKRANNDKGDAYSTDRDSDRDQQNGSSQATKKRKQ